MFGGSSKFGRGGGRGGGGGGPRNRNSFPPPPHRNHGAAVRLSQEGGSAPRQRTTASVKAVTSAAGPARASEETFSIVQGKIPLAFAMTIRLAPDLVEEIRRLEAQGGTAKIKFDEFSNNTSGNVINVGGKEFKFMWSRELDDLCDIYEERQSGEDVNGLLVESGCAWRKLNVQRTLDESTTNHVKMLSVEAELKARSRKAIVLEPGNPSLTKKLALAEANPWRMFNKQKKEPPFKKRKVDPPQVSVGGPKPAGLASNASAKGRHSASSEPSPPDQFATPSSPIGTGNLTKRQGSNIDVTPNLAKSKENIISAEKDSSTQANNAVTGTSGRKAKFCGKPNDIQSMLINLLKEAPMSLKALEKAVGGMIPNAAKKIEPILKKIATFQAPGRYFLKREVELESFKKPSCEIGSSPEDNHQGLLNAEHNYDQGPVPGTNIVDNISVRELERLDQQSCIPGGPVEQSNAQENVDIKQHSPDLFGKEKAPQNREGKTGSSSNNGSDSNSGSDSSDSGSDSGSHSRSPVGCESGGSSDTEASSNSKEGSDEDVDIMSDDDREPKHKLQPSELGFSASALPCQTDDDRTVQNKAREKQDSGGSDAVDIEGHGSDAVDIGGHGSDAVDNGGHGADAVDIDGHGSDAVDIEGYSSDEVDGTDAIGKRLPDDGWEMEAATYASAVANKEDGKARAGHFSSDHDELRERQDFIGRLFDDMENKTKDSFNHEQSTSSERLSKGKILRAPHLEHFDQKSEQTKRLKAESFTQRPVMGKDSQLSVGMSEMSPNRLDEEPYTGSTIQIKNPANREGDADFGPQRGSNKKFTGKSNSDLSDRRISQSSQPKPVDGLERSHKHIDASGHVHKPAENNFTASEALPGRTGKGSRDNQRDENFLKEKKFSGNHKDGNSVGKRPLPSDVHNSKHVEMGGKSKEAGNLSGLNIRSSPMDNNRFYLDKLSLKRNGSVLPRELSDLELGELREQLTEKPTVRRLEKKRSFKHSDNKPSTLEDCISDIDKRKPSRKSNFDLKKPSPPNASNGIKGIPEYKSEDLTRSHERVLRVDHAEAGLQYSKLVDVSNKSRQNDNGARKGVSVEGYGESQKKAAAGAPQQHGSKRGPVSHSLKESKTHTSASAFANSVDGQRDTSLTCDNSFGQKKRETSLDEDDFSYLEYEKEKPELKGPINDLSQYKEYVQEFCEKYDSYCSLNKILESYRNEFQKLGEDLEFAKGGDMERYDRILNQLRISFRECGERHKRLKNIFIVLHQELKHLKQRIKEYGSSHGKD